MGHMLCKLAAAAAIMASAAAAVASEQGGPGTIDPNTVNVRDFVRFKLAEGTSDTHYARHVADDAAGNRYVGSVLQPPTDPCCGTPFKSIITKFAPDATPVWRRERLIRVQFNDNGTSTYFEKFSPGQMEEVIGAADANSSLKLSGLATDPQGNVIATFDQYEEEFTFNNARITVLTGRTLVVKFDASGQFLWRYLAPAGTGFSQGYAGQSFVKALDTSAADGSVVVLIDNFYHRTPDRAVNHQSVVLKLRADGVVVFAVHYGISEQTELEYNSDPIAVSRDGAGRVYLVSTDLPDRNTRPTADKFMNVIRQISPTGQLLRRVDVPVYPGSAQSSNYPTDTWISGRADEAGNIYVAGTHYRGFSSSSDPGEANQLVLKFDANLTEKWRALGPQPKNTYGAPQVDVSDLALSADGVTVGGGTRSEDAVDQSKKDYRWEITRYSAEHGQVLWHRLYQGDQGEGPGWGFLDVCTAVEVDREGNVYGAGNVSVPTGGTALALIKYANNGDLQFVKFFPENAGSIQTTTLQLTSSTNRPMFFGETGDKEVAVIEFDNPAVVFAPSPTPSPTASPTPNPTASPSPNPTASPTPNPTASPSPSPEPTTSPSPSASPGPTASPTPGATPVPGRALNISTRMQVQAGDNVLIAGFIVQGEPGSSKRIILRGIGPSLGTAGLAGALADPILDLYDNLGEVILSNNDWRAGGQVAEIQATGVPPSHDLEPAIVATLTPGIYTAVLKGNHNGVGIGLVEAYDLEQQSFAQFANISTRGKVERGDDVMIGGFIVGGESSTRMLMRAIGPSLTNAGVPGALQDPTLELYDANGLVMANDDWRDTQEEELTRTNVFPSDERESALLVSLSPGSYTAVVRGFNDTTGVAVIEVYNLGSE